MRISAIILIYINIYLYYETFLRVPNSLMTHDTHDTRDTFKDFLKKVTQKFVDRNGNVVPLPSQLSTAIRIQIAVNLIINPLKLKP